MEAVIDYIGANLDGELSVRTLAGIAHFSPFHFDRQFRTHNGITIARLVRLVRLRRLRRTVRDFPAFFLHVNVGPDIPESEMITDVDLPLE
jgi:transcriptional regulator GlxA family with amidase domain